MGFTKKIGCASKSCIAIFILTRVNIASTMKNSERYLRRDSTRFMTMSRMFENSSNGRRLETNAFPPREREPDQFQAQPLIEPMDINTRDTAVKTNSTSENSSVANNAEISDETEYQMKMASTSLEGKPKSTLFIAGAAILYGAASIAVFISKKRNKNFEEDDGKRTPLYDNEVELVNNIQINAQKRWRQPSDVLTQTVKNNTCTSIGLPEFNYPKGTVV